MRGEGLGCDGVHVFIDAPVLQPPRGLLPGGLQTVAGGWQGESQQVHGRKGPGQILLPVTEVVGPVVALFFSTLKLSLSVFQRALVQEAISTTLLAVPISTGSTQS